MAIAFELVINYGSNHNAAAAARHAAVNHPPLTAGPHQVGLHKPLLGTVRGYDGKQYLEMAVLPVGVGWKVGFDRHAPHLRLTADELSELGRSSTNCSPGLPATAPRKSAGIPKDAWTPRSFNRSGPKNSRRVK